MANGETRRKIKQKVKSHIPKDWLTEIRIVYRIFLETLKGIHQTGLINIAIVTTMAAILTIFGALLRSSLSLQAVVNEIGGTLQVSAYLSPAADSKSVMSNISKIEHVKSIKFVSKQKAWDDLKNEISVPDVNNPLPDTLHIKVDDVSNLSNVLLQVKKVSGVADTSYAKDWVKKFQTLSQISHMATIIVVIGAFVLTMTIINNTIQLVIQSRKEEIEIMRLMGVSNWYIKSPLILQGSIYGFFGAIIALFPMHSVNTYMCKVHSFFMVPQDICVLFHIITIIAIITLGTFCCGFGSYMCIKKHLQV